MSEELLKTIGVNITKFRSLQGMSAEELAASSKIPIDMINRLESGIGPCSIDDFFRLTKALKIETHGLLGVDDETSIPMADENFNVCNIVAFKEMQVKELKDI